MSLVFILIILILTTLLLIYINKDLIRKIFLWLPIVLILVLFIKIFIISLCQTDYYYFLTNFLWLKNLDKIPTTYINTFLIIISILILVLLTKLNRDISTNLGTIKKFIFNLILTIFNILLAWLIAFIIFTDINFIIKLFEKKIIFTIFNLLLITSIISLLIFVVLLYHKKTLNTENQNKELNENN